MNNNKMKHIYKFTTVVLMGGLVGLYTQCVPETTKIDAKEGSSSLRPEPSVVAKDQGAIIEALEVSEGVKNYEELLLTYSELTDVPATTASIRNTFNGVSGSLPTDNEMKAFLSGHQVAISNLAAEFCNEMVNNTTRRQRIWNNANYALVKNTAFNQARKDELATKSMNLFWGPSAAAAEKAKMKLVIDDLIEDLMEGEANNTTTTREVVKGVCTATLASMHVTVK